MRLLGPPLISTPRAVKRLTNSYSLLTATHRQTHVNPNRDDASDALDGAAMMLLAAVIGYPELGPALFVHLHRTTHRPSPPDWSSFLASLEPAAIENHGGGWANPTDPHMSPATAQRWREMTSALRAVNTAAEAADIPLPTSLSSWARRVVPSPSRPRPRNAHTGATAS